MTTHCTVLRFARTLAGTWLICARVAYADDLGDLRALSLEELLQIDVTSVGKKAQPIGETPAAIAVITQEDIRRSTANNLPDLLRSIPGLHVARIDANKWSVTSRGFSGRFADDMAVMIDSRVVYSPLLAGVFWEAQDLPLEDIERIEVTRGPGGTLWGANVTNGMVHVITKSARASQGGVVRMGGGSAERAFGTLRYGGQLTDQWHYRLYAKGFAHTGFLDGAAGQDDWRRAQLGVRSDWEPSTNDTVTLQGDYYRGDISQRLATLQLDNSLTTEDDAQLSGGNVGLRWSHRDSAARESTLQFYFDRNRRREKTFAEARDSITVDFQQRFQPTTHHDVVWGVGYYYTADDTREDALLTFSPSSRALQTRSAFVQDEITLVENRVRVSLGAKYLHHSYVGDVFLPSARLLWTPSTQQTIWAAITRSARLPSRFERDGRQSFIQETPEVKQLLGNPAFGAEIMWGYEAGYRVQFGPHLGTDLALFYNTYRHAEAEKELDETTIQLNNQRNVSSYGAELALDWRITPSWRLRPAFTWLQVRHQIAEGSESDDVGTDPVHQVSLRSQVDLTSNLQFDVNFRHVDRLPGINIPAYQSMDTRLGWRMNKVLEFAVVGQNLLHSQQLEYVPSLTATPLTAIPRAFFAQVSWRF